MSYLIDEIYSKERRYIKNVDKDNFLNAKSPIFRLDQFRHLKSNTGVEKRDYSRLVAQQLQEEDAGTMERRRARDDMAPVRPDVGAMGGTGGSAGHGAG